MKKAQAIKQMTAEIVTNTLKGRRAHQGSTISGGGPGGLRRPRRRPARWLLAGALLIAPVIALTWNARRAKAQATRYTYVINQFDDAGDGVCDSTCTLRDAVLAANAAPEADTITFDSAVFAAPGPHTISLSGALPNLSSDMTIRGPGANILTVLRDTGGDYRIFTIDVGQTVTISGLTISRGAALANLDPLGDGGGILNLGALTLTNSVVSGNAARFCGGGICNRGTATVINSRVISNYSDHSGGGIGNRGALTMQNSTVSDNSSLFYGGGVFNRWTATACSVTGSTVSGNSTGDSGGGIFSEGPLTLTSSTVSGNSSARHGGGIADEGTLSVTSATITNNRADVDNNNTGTGGGIFFQYDFPLLRNTIVANNYRGRTSTTDDDIVSGAWGDLDSSSSFNLIGEGGSGGLTHKVNSNQVATSAEPVDPLLGPLQNNGGPTETHALLAGSPAIDKGANFGLTTDQRGFLRPFDIASDIGAYEFGSSGGWSTATPTGRDVTVTAGPVTVTFRGVTQAGDTTVMEIDPATATLPGGYSLGEGLPAYEITTTAQYTPPVTVCLYLPSVNDKAKFDTLRVLHGEGGMFVDCTVPSPDSDEPDFNSRTICARVTSLSPFVVAQLLTPNPTPTPTPEPTPEPTPTPTGDTTAPTVSISAPSDGATFVKGQAAAAGYSCQDEPGGSGLASCTGTVANGAPIDTSTVGSHAFNVTGVDVAGNSAMATSTYHVVYGFSGFLQPVENLPALNIANAGGAIPVKFSLGGDQGLAIFAAGYPASSPIPCDAGEAGTVIEETVAAGGSSLSYDATTGRYKYVWKTDRAWEGTCRMLVVRFNDGAEHRAKFRFN